MFGSRSLTQISNKLNSVTTTETEVEIEAKFGYYTRGKFESSVPFRRFNALKKTLSEKLKSTKQHTTDYRSNTGVRKQIVSVENGEDMVMWQRKRTIHHFSSGLFYDYGIRVSINSEVDIPPVTDFVHDLLRIKDRESFIYKGFLRIDMTVVHPQGARLQEPRLQGAHLEPGASEEDCSYKTKYEVEVEILDWHVATGKKIGEFNRLLKWIFLILYDTATLYTIKERRNLFFEMNTILGEKKGTILHFDMVAQARNLKYGDMVWGGLVGHERVVKGKKVANRYSVTHKADGIRKFLAVDKTGVWLVFPPEEANLVYRFTPLNHDYSLIGLILDGELVPKNRRKTLVGTQITDENVAGIEIPSTKELEKLSGFPGSKYWFLVFDALAIDSDKDVQFRPHAQRMNEAYQAVNRMEDINDNSRLLINFKSFRQIASPEDFFLVMMRMFDEKALLPYDDDGFIFMSEMAPYNPIPRSKRRNLKLWDRRLTKISDICKWKPVERLTIDFSITHRLDGKVNLLSLVGRDKCVPFKGTLPIPFDVEEMVDHDHPLLREYPAKTIIEFEWNFNKEKFVPVMARLDKQKPNRMDIATDDWGDIHNPITQDVLTGKNFRMMKKYHNRIKRSLFQKVRGERYLLDIGSGLGGDVASWKGFDKVVAVEPNNDHIEELTRRIESNGMSDKIHIVQSGGEDTSAITAAVKSFIGKKVDVVSLMLSMTFFWKNERMLRSLVDTIVDNLKEGGIIIFVTMNGDTVEEVFDPFFRGIPTSKLIFHRTSEDRGYATLRLQPQDEVKKGNGRKAYVYIEDSIVGSRSSEGSETSRSSEGSETSREIENPVDINQLDYEIPVIYSPTRTTISRTEIESVEIKEKVEEVVIEQEEYLVHLDDFERLLNEKRVISSKSIFRADREAFLTEAEKRWSMMYSFGEYIVSADNVSSEDMLKDGYALWKKVREMSDYLENEYGSRIIPPFKRFNLNNTRVFGDLTQVDTSSEESFGRILTTFEKDLKSNKVSEGDVVDILDYVEAEYPLVLELEKDVSSIETELPGLLKIGDGYFYVNDERMRILEGLNRGVANIVLTNYATTIVEESNLLPKDFVHRVLKMWPRSYLIEAGVTPLTSKIILLGKDFEDGHYSSILDADKSFGSIGQMGDWVLFETPEETSTTIIAFNTPYNVDLKDSVDMYMGMLEATPEGKHLRIILFVPMEDAELRDSAHEEISESGFMLYERGLIIQSKNYQIYVLESSPSSTKLADLRALFENFGEFEVETPDMELIRRYVPEGGVIEVI